MRRRDFEYPAKDVLVVCVRTQQDYAGGSDARVEKIADERSVREVIHGEGEFVSVRGGVAGVGDPDARVRHQSAQWPHRAGGHQILRPLPRVADVGQPGEVAADLVDGCTRSSSFVGHLGQCLTCSTD
jgi:hypothetical protein